MSAIKSELTNIQRDASQLDRACKSQWGVSALMFRTVKFAFYIATLVFAGFVLETTATDPFVVLAFVALLITGPEGFETWLVNQGRVPEHNDDQNN